MGCSRSNGNRRTTRLDGYIRCAVITKSEGEADGREGRGEDGGNESKRAKGWRLTVLAGFRGVPMENRDG